MCDCIKIIEGKLSKKCLKEKGFNKPFKKVELEKSFYIINDKMLSKTFSNALITLEGQKKKIKKIILHTHCPYCGAVIDDIIPEY